jgi:hypothetical protein
MGIVVLDAISVWKHVQQEFSSSMKTVLNLLNASSVETA